MHIAFVSQLSDAVLPPTQNSIGLWTYHVARRLATTHKVTVYMRRQWSKTQATGNEPFGCRFVPVLPSRAEPFATRLHKVFSSPTWPPFAVLANGIEYALQVALDLRRQKVDIIHVHNYTQFVPVIRAFNPHARIVLHMQAEWLSQLDGTRIERRIRHVDQIIGCSDHITNLVARRFPQYARRCRTINNGVDFSIFDRVAPPPRREGEKRLLFVGRVSQEKGIHLLLEAFQQVAAQYPQARLDIVGPYASLPREYIVTLSDDEHVQRLDALYDGRPYMDHLRERVPPALSDRVTFHGGMPQADTTAFYHQADVLVNPSLSESFGMTVVEANLCGVPAVVSRVGGMKETVLEGETGLITAPGDTADLARAILELLQDDTRRQEMGQNARARVVERYSWEKIAAQTLELYQELYRSSHKPAFQIQPKQTRS